LSVAPAGLEGLDGFYPQLKLRAIFACPCGTQFPTRLRSKEAGQKFAAGIVFKREMILAAKRPAQYLLIDYAIGTRIHGKLPL
jgi:hypothetical protein